MPAASVSTSRRDRPTWRRIACAALVAALLLAAGRMLLIGLKDGYAREGLDALALRSAARHLLEGFSLCLLPLLLAAWAGARLRWKWVTLAFVPLVVLVLGYLFVAFRLPREPYYAPAFEGGRAWLAHGGALLTALLAALGLRTRRPVPGLPLATAAGVVLLSVAAAVHIVARGDAGRLAERPNLVLISLDTLRKDHLGCYGYEPPTSPELDRFAERSLRFTNAFSPQPWTLTAHMSMLTGLYPSVHGVDEQRSLPEDVPTAAQRLRQAGYTTLAIIDTVAWLAPEYGFARGFQHFEVMPESAAMKADRMLDVLEDLGDERFFLFAHFYDAHSDRAFLPYDADPRDQELFAGWFDGDLDGCGGELGAASTYLRALAERGDVLEGHDLAYLVDLYDAGIRSMDRELGRLLRGMEDMGRLADTVVLVTADHGEAFFEHGQPLHGQYYDECLAVPFLLSAPGGRAGVVDDPVTLVDVMPTLLDFGGVGDGDVQGRSLASFVDGGPPAQARDYVLLETGHGVLGLRWRDWSLVPVGREHELYRTAVDPGQREDLLGSPPDGAPDVEAALEREQDLMTESRRRFAAEAAEVTTSREELEQLRALGYGGDER